MDCVHEGFRRGGLQLLHASAVWEPTPDAKRKEDACGAYKWSKTSTIEKVGQLLGEHL